MARDRRPKRNKPGGSKTRGDVQRGVFKSVKKRRATARSELRRIDYKIAKKRGCMGCWIVPTVIFATFIAALVL